MNSTIAFIVSTWSGLIKLAQPTPLRRFRILSEPPWPSDKYAIIVDDGEVILDHVLSPYARIVEVKSREAT